MLTDKDINRIVTACRAEFATRIEMQEFKDDMIGRYAALIATVDGYSKKADEYMQEMRMQNVQLGRHERWHHETADKIGIKLEY
ncbi:MAG: hypothetical protein RL641_599 [Candidatus Parcubacteria bacterium]|jgi:hypothetical protein